MDQPITYERVTIRDFDINDPRIERKEQITTIPAGLKDVLERTIASVKPQRCQNYVIAILEALSKSGQVPCSGILDYFKGLAEPSLYEKTKKDPFCGDTLFDLSATAMFTRVGRLKRDKCCY
ncbi:hypothetical protein BDV12DRAFT_201601 [Aspergillus spectabilis]